MCDIEVDLCDFCHESKPVERTYLKPSKYIKPEKFEEYDELWNQGDYFIIIKTCSNCGKPQMKQTTIPKQETLEEAAENYAVQFLLEDEQETDSANRKQAFKEGAKWQQERMYSEDDLIAFYNFIENHQLRKFGDVWKRITNNPNDKPLNFESVDDNYIIEWFEQFKKK